MVTTLKEKNGKLYCGHCRMLVEDLSQSSYCEFCGYSWANWEHMMEKYYQDILIDEVEEKGWRD